MRSASCGFENTDRIESLQLCPPVSNALPLPARAQTLSGSMPWPLAVMLLTSPGALEGQRKQVAVAPDVIEERE